MNKRTLDPLHPLPIAKRARRSPTTSAGGEGLDASQRVASPTICNFAPEDSSESHPNMPSSPVNPPAPIPDLATVLWGLAQLGQSQDAILQDSESISDSVVATASGVSNALNTNGVRDVLPLSASNASPARVKTPPALGGSGTTLSVRSPAEAVTSRPPALPLAAMNSDVVSDEFTDVTLPPSPQFRASQPVHAPSASAWNTLHLQTPASVPLPSTTPKPAAGTTTQTVRTPTLPPRSLSPASLSQTTRTVTAHLHAALQALDGENHALRQALEGQRARNAAAERRLQLVLAAYRVRTQEAETLRRQCARAAEALRAVGDERDAARAKSRELEAGVAELRKALKGRTASLPELASVGDRTSRVGVLNEENGLLKVQAVRLKEAGGVRDEQERCQAEQLPQRSQLLSESNAQILAQFEESRAARRSISAHPDDFHFPAHLPPAAVIQPVPDLRSPTSDSLITVPTQLYAIASMMFSAQTEPRPPSPAFPAPGPGPELIDLTVDDDEMDVDLQGPIPKPGKDRDTAVVRTEAIVKTESDTVNVVVPPLNSDEAGRNVTPTFFSFPTRPTGTQAPALDLDSRSIPHAPAIPLETTVTVPPAGGHGRHPSPKHAHSAYPGFDEPPIADPSFFASSGGSSSNRVQYRLFPMPDQPGFFKIHGVPCRDAQLAEAVRVLSSSGTEMTERSWGQALELLRLRAEQQQRAAQSPDAPRHSLNWREMGWAETADALRVYHTRYLAGSSPGPAALLSFSRAQGDSSPPRIGGPAAPRPGKLASPPAVRKASAVSSLGMPEPHSAGFAAPKHGPGSASSGFEGLLSRRLSEQPAAPRDAGGSFLRKLPEWEAIRTAESDDDDDEQQQQVAAAVREEGEGQDTGDETDQLTHDLVLSIIDNQIKEEPEDDEPDPGLAVNNAIERVTDAALVDAAVSEDTDSGAAIQARQEPGLDQENTPPTAGDAVEEALSVQPQPVSPLLTAAATTEPRHVAPDAEPPAHRFSRGQLGLLWTADDIGLICNLCLALEPAILTTRPSATPPAELTGHCLEVHAEVCAVFRAQTDGKTDAEIDAWSMGCEPG
ncbi:unnamed protein product [Mycena citricolor]|uniref:Uncharacterized protein n=1 Tax=Mycena citricolor TaxID=2018698 RepID=A0AAD2H9B4_9AGAR|nr:unnamed protein product [Mycena citricolor]